MISLCFLFSGCLLFQPDKAVLKTVKGIEEEYNVNLDTLAHDLGKNATEGVVNGLTNDTSQARIEAALGPILHQLRDSINKVVVDSRDSLMSDYTKQWIKELSQELAATLQVELGHIIDDPIAPKLDMIVAQMIDRMTNETTVSKLSNARDSLLGPGMQTITDSLVRTAVRSAMDEFNKNYDEKLGKKLKGALGDAGKAAEDALVHVRSTLDKVKSLAWTLGGLGLVLLIVAGYFWLKGKRHKNTLKIMTWQVDKIPDQRIYDGIIKKVTEEAVKQGLEQHLIGVLKEQNLYQQPEWTDKNRQLLNLVKESLRGSDNQATIEELVQKIKSSASNKGLDGQVGSVLEDPS